MIISTDNVMDFQTYREGFCKECDCLSVPFNAGIVSLISLGTKEMTVGHLYRFHNNPYSIQHCYFTYKINNKYMFCKFKYMAPIK